MLKLPKIGTVGFFLTEGGFEHSLSHARVLDDDQGCVASKHTGSFISKYRIPFIYIWNIGKLP
jgi:hypothetical protein